MAGDSWDVGSRFRDEQEFIERYVRLLRARSTLHDRQVQDLNRILKRVHIDQLPVRRYERTGEAYTADELTKLVNAIRGADPEVYQTILGHEQGLDAIPSFGLDGPAAEYVPLAEYMDRLDEWIDYFADQLSDDLEEDDLEGMLQHALREAEKVEAEHDEEDRILPEALKTLLSTALDHAQNVWLRRCVDAMVYAREQFEEIEVLARMATPGAEINVLRQGFVLLMTAFDAAVFDLTRIAFRRKFFELVGVFGKQDRVTLEEIGEARSFEAFRDRVIEEQLRRRYVKDLIGLLQTIGVELVDEKRGDKPVQLVELVLRRNLHVHNRGVVDPRYLEADPKTGNPKYNLFDLKAGQTAVIDDAYFQTALRLCGDCVDRLVRWASV
jgi:hypothetical protein